MQRFIAELRRRNVLRVAGLYLAGTWLIVQVLGTVLPFFDAPLWIARTLTIVLAVGFVPALVLAWVFEWTPQGLRRDDAVAAPALPHSGRRIDRLIMVVLALAIGYFAFDKFVLAPQRQVAVTAEARREGRSDAIKDTFGDRSIAVLPFADMSQAHDQQYLSDGIADELLNNLARVRELRVISRSSAFQFRERTQSIPEIARKLDVGYILDGSIRKAGNRVRITVQLIDGRSDTQLWNDVYDRPLDDIFAIQDEIGASVVAQLKVKLLGSAIPRTRRTVPEAYTVYLQALAVSRKETEEAYDNAVGLLKQALAIDPGFTPAWNLLATIYSSQAGLGLISAEEGFKLVRTTADRILELDPENGQAFAQLAMVSFARDGDTAAAARQMQRALALDPGNMFVLGAAEDIAKSLGRLDEAVALNEYMVARDPMLSNAYSQLCLAYLQDDRLNASIALCRTALEMEPEQMITHSFIGTALLLKGEFKQALAEMQQEPFEPFRLFGEAMAYHSLGQKARSDAALAQIVAKYDKDAAYNIAYVEAWRGNTDQAFMWLDKAVEYKDSGLPMLAIEPLFKSLHNDPRWAALLQRLGKSPEQLVRIEFKVNLPESSGAVVPSR